MTKRAPGRNEVQQKLLEKRQNILKAFFFIQLLWHILIKQGFANILVSSFIKEIWIFG